MTRSALLKSWFIAPPLSAKWALPWIAISLPVATLIRATLGCPDAFGECCSALLIYVLLSAIFLGSLGAAIATLFSIGLSAFLWSTGTDVTAWFWPGERMQMHMAHHVLEFWGLGLFLVYSVLIIGAVEYTRRTFIHYSRLPRELDTSGGLIFSLEDGQAWASWHGTRSPVRLGSKEEVAPMMEDFIRQVELGERFERLQAASARG